MPKWGDLFSYVVKVLRRCKPQFFLLENVPNLQKHAGGSTWNTILAQLTGLGYKVEARSLSPHQFGIPQVRYRTLIVGCRGFNADFSWPEIEQKKPSTLREYLEARPVNADRLVARHVEYIEAWNELLSALPKNQDLPSFPIWAMEFGATYPVSSGHACADHARNINRYRGAFGVPLKGLTGSALQQALPAYARSAKSGFPKWKVRFIEQNRAFYFQHAELIDKWLPKIREFPASFQKLEWNWKGGPRNLWSTVLQFRASGIRAKRPIASPSLVSLTTSQVPIVGWERRYVTIEECARLQSLESLAYMPASKTDAYRALGNAVNAEVIYRVAKGFEQVNRSKATSISLREEFPRLRSARPTRPKPTAHAELSSTTTDFCPRAFHLQGSCFE